MSVAEFCQSYGITPWMFYALLRTGKAPDTMRVGRRRIISIAAAERWQQAMEAAAAAA
jgi:hypothetical protein